MNCLFMEFEDYKEIFEKLRAVLCDFFDVESSEITASTTFEELGAGSLDMIDIAMSIEDEFGMECPDEALFAFVTVGDAAAFIASDK